MWESPEDEVEKEDVAMMNIISDDGGEDIELQDIQIWDI